jgi:DNA-binding NarL/FixJ family response regulator
MAAHGTRGAGRLGYAAVAMGDEPIRVLLCDDAEGFRAFIRYALQEDAGIIVVGEAADGEAGLKAVADLLPDVVLLDLTMPRLGGIEAIPAMLEHAPATRIIALSGHRAEQMQQEALSRGAFAYLQKTDDAETIRTAVREAGAAGPPLA